MITIRAKPEEIVWQLTPRGVEAININFDQLYQDALRVATVLGIDDAGVAHLTMVGSITATAGLIGGWTIGATSLTAGSGANTVGLDSGGTNPALYAGSATPSTASFRVTKAGALFASNATIAGVVTVNTGYIGGTGGWVIGAGLISATNAKIGSNGTTGYVSFGATPPTTYGNNVGAWLGYDTTAKFSLYADATHLLQFDGATFALKSNSVTIDNSGLAVSAGTSLDWLHSYQFSGLTLGGYAGLVTYETTSDRYMVLESYTSTVTAAGKPGILNIWSGSQSSLGLETAYVVLYAKAPGGAGNTFAELQAGAARLTLWDTGATVAGGSLAWGGGAALTSSGTVLTEG